MEDGQVITTSRTVAVIVYFTQDWTESDGGLLVDLEDSSGQPKAYVPEVCVFVYVYVYVYVCVCVCHAWGTLCKCCLWRTG